MQPCAGKYHHIYSLSDLMSLSQVYVAGWSAVWYKREAVVVISRFLRAALYKAWSCLSYTGSFSSQLTSLLHGTSHAVEVCLCVCLSVTLSRSCCRLSSKVATLVEEVFRRQAMVYTAFTVETLLVFVYKLLTNSVSQPAAAPRYVPVADTFCTLWYPQTQTRSPCCSTWVPSSWL